jgi:hypothetical protein
MSTMTSVLEAFEAKVRAARVARDRLRAAQGGAQASLEAAGPAGGASETLRLQERRDERRDESAAALAGREARMGVYAIRNTVDGAMYVGSGPDIDLQWGRHRAALDRASHHNDRLQVAWIRHGAPAFELVILERVEDRDTLAQAEQGWINRYGAEDLHQVYNSQTRVIRKLRKLLPLAEAAQRLGLRPATLRGWVDTGRVSCHRASPDGSRRADPEQIRFDPEELGRARERKALSEGLPVARIAARLRAHQQRAGRWLRLGRPRPEAHSPEARSPKAHPKEA